jgi:ankyrin repeat protein
MEDADNWVNQDWVEYDNLINPFMQERPKNNFRLRNLGLVVTVVGITGLAFLLASRFETNPLLKAAKSGDLIQVKKFISENPNLVHSRTLMGDTPLILAVESGNSNVVAVLIEAGADVNAKDDSRITPLHWAAFYGRVTIAEMLLKAGADINATGFRHNNTPLQVAAAHGHAEVAEILISHGANLAAEDMLGKTALQFAEENHYTNVIVVLTNTHSVNP